VLLVIVTHEGTVPVTAQEAFEVTLTEELPEELVRLSVEGEPFTSAVPHVGSGILIFP
jgi:hypothetical protein